MKILRLDLLAFGSFSGHSLALDQGEYGLHLVYGPNEAGKSTALRALRQFLYGIPHSSSDNFVHAHPKLRIGGVLESAGGERLECIRRKGRSKTLRGPDDVEVVEEARLRGMLGGVDEVTFGQRFGIDYEELRRGGRAVVEGGGDLGNILFAAGSGMADLRDVQKKLEDEADELFRPRAQVPRISKALSDLGEARRMIKEALLPTSEWIACDRDLAEAAQRREEIQQQLQERRMRKSRLERVAKALPLLVRRERTEKERAEVADAPLLPDDFSGTRREAQTQLGHARDTEREAAKAIEMLQGKMAELQVPEELLQNRSAIHELHTQRGSILQAAEDRPGLVAEREAAERQARRILRELDREPELGQAEGLRLSRAQRQRIQSLAEDCKARLDKSHSIGGQVKKLQERIRRLQTQRDDLAPARNVGELQQAVWRAQKAGDLDQQLAESRAELETLEKQAEVDRSKLPWFQGSLEQLEQLAVPALETIERFENDLSDAQTRLERIDERMEEYQRQAGEIEQSLHELQLEGDVPTEDDLVRVRQRRNEGWELLRAVQAERLRAEDDAPRAFVAEFAAGSDLERAFLASIEQADRVADRLRREADRVAKKARLTADRRKLEGKLAEQQEQRREAARRQEEVGEQWNQLWAPLHLPPHSPREMRSWRHQQQALAETLARIRRQRDEVQRLEARVESLRQDLSERLGPLEQSPDRQAGKLDNLEATLERCEAVLQAAEESNRQRRSLEEQLELKREELMTAEQAAEEADTALEQWRIEWADAVARLGLERDAQPSEAHTVLESVDELLDRLDQAQKLEERIKGIDHRAGVFEQTVRRVLERVADDLLPLAPEEAVVRLYDRLQTASDNQTKLEQWQEQVEKEETRFKNAQSRSRQFEAALENLCRQAGCASPDELPAVEQRSARRREVETDLKSIHEQLDGLTAGGSLEELIAEAEQFDQDELLARRQQLEDEIQRLEQENDGVNERIGRRRTELEKMDGGGKAAEAREQVEYLLASIRSDAEEYVRLRLASAVLRRSIERFREASQGPVMDRAGELFSALTLGSFAGIRANYDDKGTAVLEGVRAGTQQGVLVDGMSDGTCDQLYLALRLALLESTLEAMEPLPFIVDDILIMFDDDRAAAALRIFGELSRRTQVVFFTHHQHLVELARQTLDDDILYVHQLEQQQPAV